MRLDEFRLESHDERAALLYVLSLMRDDSRASYHLDAIKALLDRLSDTECQEGGCEICRPDLNPPYEDDCRIVWEDRD